jgi:hypothetical protein
MTLLSLEMPERKSWRMVLVEQLFVGNSKSQPKFANLKVHFAGAEQLDQSYMAYAAGVQYALFTCFPFISKQFGVKGFPLIVNKPGFFVPHELAAMSKHVIIVFSIIEI